MHQREICFNDNSNDLMVSPNILLPKKDFVNITISFIYIMKDQQWIHLYILKLNFPHQ